MCVKVLANRLLASYQLQCLLDIHFKTHFNYFQCVLDECSINTGTYLVNAITGVKLLLNMHNKTESTILISILKSLLCLPTTNETHGSDLVGNLLICLENCFFLWALKELHISELLPIGDDNKKKVNRKMCLDSSVKPQRFFSWRNNIFIITLCFQTAFSLQLLQLYY